jgi:hypothetical protein
MKTEIHLTENLRELAQKHFVLLEPANIAKKRDNITLNVSGYSDVMYMIADLTKVCILAMGDGNYHSSAHIPSPESNISGVLSIILDLIPYEEIDLLDKIREAFLNPEPKEEPDWDFILATISVGPTNYPESEEQISN